MCVRRQRSVFSYRAKFEFLILSVQSMPEYFEFKDSVYTDGETTIKPDSEVRMRLQGVKYEPTGIVRFLFFKKNVSNIFLKITFLFL